jgi:hypothetical protein
MSLAMLGAIFLIVLIIMWRLGLTGTPMIVVAVLLGVIIASTAGPMSTGAHTVIGAVQTFFGAVASMFGGKAK